MPGPGNKHECCGGTWDWDAAVLKVVAAVSYLRESRFGSTSCGLQDSKLPKFLSTNPEKIASQKNRNPSCKEARDFANAAEQN
jgi:hypothetical protein